MGVPDGAGAPTPRPVAPGGPARALVSAHEELVARASAVLAAVDDARGRVVAIVAAERERRARDRLADLDVDRLADITERNLRVQALRAAGYLSVLDVLDARPEDLERHDGVGPHTARSAVAGAEQVAEVVRAGVRLRIELRRDAGWATELLGLLARLEHLAPAVDARRRLLADYAGTAGPALRHARVAANRWTFALRRPATRRQARAALAALAGWEPTLPALTGAVAALEEHVAAPVPGPVALWEDFERRAAAYYALLGDLVPVGDAVAAAGMLPAALVERIRVHPLDTALLRVRLRGYQAFGARFALNQGRVLLGDEMGLGKTVQAIAAMAHLAAGGERHFLVVCPASVLVGWGREVARHSTLAAHRLHGPRRDEAAERWAREGGVAVTTFEGLRHVPRPGRDAGAPAVGMLVVDEAHLVKNPQARRSLEVAAWAQACWRVLLLTGTPMENRLEEFATLVGYLQPDVAAALPRHLELAGPDLFRSRVASVYLRRNADDVLVELPDLVVVEEWEEHTAAGERLYAQAVASGNLMAMRRADLLAPDPRDSGKLGRLREIVTEARENGHRVVVFSYFRDVLDRVVEVLRADGGPVLGPLTGSVPATDRQRLVDELGAAPAGAAQVQAGGVGLNVQAASVVVLTEPQLKPATEAQAIARVHRMGQVRTVQVHRLLVEDSVDERIEEILGEKRRLFDAYVRDSALAAGATAAVDVSEVELARRVVAAEQARLGYGPVWEELEQDEPAEP